MALSTGNNASDVIIDDDIHAYWCRISGDKSNKIKNLE